MAKSSSFFKKIAMFFATAAIAAMLVPAVAFANQTVDVTWTDANGPHTENVDLTVLAANTDDSTTKYGTLFYKDNVWRVVGTDLSVPLSSVFYNAYYTANGNTYRASDVWASGAELTIYTTDFPDGYTKWSGFTYDNLNPARNFYGDTTATTLGNVATQSYSARIALRHGTAQITGTQTASDVLNGLTCGTYSVRLIWGYLDANNQGGNRFPDSITEIEIN